MKVAVVGSGVSGLAATYLLNECSPHEVHLFEAADYVGGHTHTVSFKPKGSDHEINVDTGFIVFNPVTYPNFLRFLRDVKKVPILESNMSFSVTRDRGLFEWAGTSPAALFAQTINLFSPSHWRMIWDIIRFNTFAPRYLASHPNSELSIGQYLDANGYGDAFKDNYLLPMTAAVWSTPPDAAALDFPALTLIRFLHNHHLLQILGQPQWLTVKNGSITYVNSIIDTLPKEQLHLNTPISSISRSAQQYQLHTPSGKSQEFDHVIFASHADTTLAILGDAATEEERRILSQFHFGKNVATLHSDKALMPQRRVAYAAWNYLTATDKSSGRANVNNVALTYWMNLLQSIPEDKYGPVLVTLNPPYPPAPKKTHGSWEYEHPLMTGQSVAAQSELHKIQNKRGLSFAGAWTKYGFHEDGFSSGLRAAAALPGVTCPFEILPAERDHSEGGSVLSAVIQLLELFRRLLAVLGIGLLWERLYSQIDGRAKSKIE